MVEVYKTNVRKRKSGDKIILKFSKIFPDLKVNFDLEDCDKILRIEGVEFCGIKAGKLVKRMGYKCKLLK